METEVHYCIVLSQAQQDYLLASRTSVGRNRCLHSLLRMAVRVATPYRIKGFETVLHPGQVAVSEVELAGIWRCTRKTVGRVLDRMNALRLVSSETNNRTSVHTLLCLSGWITGDGMLRNPFYTRPTPNIPTRNGTENTTALLQSPSPDTYNAAVSCDNADGGFPDPSEAEAGVIAAQGDFPIYPNFQNGKTGKREDGADGNTQPLAGETAKDAYLPTTAILPIGMDGGDGSNAQEERRDVQT